MAQQDVAVLEEVHKTVSELVVACVDPNREREGERYYTCHNMPVNLPTACRYRRPSSSVVTGHRQQRATWSLRHCYTDRTVTQIVDLPNADRPYSDPNQLYTDVEDIIVIEERPSNPG